MKFENALKKLEEIVVRLESGETTLDESLELYIAGVEALRNCEKLLSEAEHKVEILLKDGRSPFDEGQR